MYFFWKPRKTENYLGLGSSLLWRVYSSRMFFFFTYKENWYFRNKRMSICYDMALHFFHFHHHIDLFDYLLHLIFDQIPDFYAECNFCTMHCSCDKQKLLNLDDLTYTWSFRTAAASIIFRLPFSINETVVSNWRWKIMHFKRSKLFSFVSCIINIFW